ncbi:unnamed protein product [Gadus morhua 'NCC']
MATKIKGTMRGTSPPLLDYVVWHSKTQPKHSVCIVHRLVRELHGESAPSRTSGQVPRCGPCPMGNERRKWGFVLLRVTSAMWRPDEMGASPSVLPLIGP